MQMSVPAVPVVFNGMFNTHFLAYCLLSSLVVLRKFPVLRKSAVLDGVCEGSFMVLFGWRCLN